MDTKPLTMEDVQRLIAEAVAAATAGKAIDLPAPQVPTAPKIDLNAEYSAFAKECRADGMKMAEIVPAWHAHKALLTETATEVPA